MINNSLRETEAYCFENLLVQPPTIYNFTNNQNVSDRNYYSDPEDSEFVGANVNVVSSHQ